MSKKNQLTACQPLPWEDVLRLVENLKSTGDFRMALFISLCSMGGLRAGDALNLFWRQIINTEELQLREKKTEKVRRIYLNDKLKEIIALSYEKMKEKRPGVVTPDNYVFLNRFGEKPIGIKYIDKILPGLLKKNNIEIKYSGTGSHMFRKSFGARIFFNDGCSESSLILLSELFNHSSIKITRAYIGLSSQQYKAAFLGL
jgi:integrase